MSQSNISSTTAEDALISRSIDTLRVLSADMVEKANSGHPGAPMGCAPMAHVLFKEVMNYSPSNPKWFNRDRFVLSNGHACALLYSLLHLTGYDLSLRELQLFRQLGSRTPGHPENALTPGVEVSTGPLGQGISNAVGMAMAERHLAAVYNNPSSNPSSVNNNNNNSSDCDSVDSDFSGLIDHFTFVICGDGCLQEGISSEACSLAGHHKLSKLVVLYDDNHISIDGDTALTFTEDVQLRFQSYGWQVLVVDDGNDIVAIRAAIAAAKLETEKPTLIKVRTVIGFGSGKAGSESSHGAPLGAADIAAVKTRFGFDPAQSFVVPPEVSAYYATCAEEGSRKETAWQLLLSRYQQQHPQLAAELTRRISGELPIGWQDALPENPSDEGAKAAATRNYSGDILNALAAAAPELIGGSADLSGSNCALLHCCGAFQAATPQHRFIHFGVREHAMVAICNGLYAHGAMRPYCATFLNFIGYALGAVRVSALSQLPVLFLLTHDSIGLGEDGPTHQPVEMLESLRAVPNLYVFRPADKSETKGSYVMAMSQCTTPSVLSLSRQTAPYIQGTSADSVKFGAYTVQEFHTTASIIDSNSSNSNSSKLPYPTLTLIGTGTELLLALQVAKKLVDDANTQQAPMWVRVVSMPCCELFDAQPLPYKLSVLPAGSPVMSIEAGGVLGWRRYAHAPFGILGSFGLSAPASDMFRHFGFSVENIAPLALQLVQHYTPPQQQHPVAPSLIDVFLMPVIQAPH